MSIVDGYSRSSAIVPKFHELASSRINNGATTTPLDSANALGFYWITET